MNGEILKIVCLGRSGAEAGVVEAARGFGVSCEIAVDIAAGLARSDAAMIVCDDVPDSDGETVRRLCAESGKPCEVCDLKLVPDDLVWMPLLETAQQLDSLAGEIRKGQMTLFVCGTRECEASGIERKAKAVFDHDWYYANVPHGPAVAAGDVKIDPSMEQTDGVRRNPSGQDRRPSLRHVGVHA